MYVISNPGGLPIGLNGQSAPVDCRGTYQSKTGDESPVDCLGVPLSSVSKQSLQENKVSWDVNFCPVSHITVPLLLCSGSFLVHGEFTPYLMFGVNAWLKAMLIWVNVVFFSISCRRCASHAAESTNSHLLQTGRASSRSLQSLDFPAALSFSTFIALASNARTNSGFVFVTHEDSAFFDHLNLNFLAPDCTYSVYCPLWQPPATPGLLALYLRVSKIVLNHDLIVYGFHSFTSWISFLIAFRKQI